MDLSSIQIEKELQIVFMGTPEFAVPVLEGLLENYNIRAVVTQPDKVRGRDGEVSYSPIKKVALEIYQILGCRGLARIDMFYTKEGNIVFNEVNTIPGFTSHSRFPLMLLEIGYRFSEVIDKLIELGLEK